MNYPLFLKEYFDYIKKVPSSEKDSFDVNTIMKPLYYNSNRSVLRDNRNKIFLNILTKYFEKFGDDYDISKIQDFGISIYVKEMNMNPEKITKYTITAIFKKFTQYVAGLTEDEFPEIKKIHNSPGFQFPREFYTLVDVVAKPTIQESVKNRKRKEAEILNIQPSEKRPKIDNLATSAKTLVSFMKNISKEAESKQDIALIKMLIEKNSKDEEMVQVAVTQAPVVQVPVVQVPVVQAPVVQAPVAQVPVAQVPVVQVPVVQAQAPVPNKKDFIKTLPFPVFKILKEKGCVDFSGFIKPVKLTSEEELSINSTEILLSLYENGLII